MEQTEEERETTDISRVQPFLGTNERTTSDGKGYPKGISQFETSSEEKIGNDWEVKHSLPTERTILDDDMQSEEGASDDRFTDPIDVIPSKRRDPKGPHNMQGYSNIYYDIANKTRLKNLNRV